MSPKIVTVLLGVNMNSGHKALSEIIKTKLKINVSSLDFGRVVLCINKKGDKLKAIGARGMVLGYVKTPNGQRLMLDAIQYLPRTFGSSGFDYDAAVRKVLENRFSQKQAGPLAAHRAKKAAGLLEARI